ncbi:acyl-CoA dehydrogenase [Phreatobacter sp. AB_2022a]|uniref:acyl-CoA dehydrogenase n=1 Tax=Phreatobacter sp. AB_2022a TaxID=3003134 RepID=UPI0022871F7F|nr:acyl-CoA dehydrogenase [Phreatobacter sp. AB_2022a]MCZ0732623.1 acyl-CoA dehydrogenase [Phreatobacter sp. AB_2022a]
MTERADLNLMRDSARRALSQGPGVRELARGEAPPPAAADEAMALAAAQGWTAMLAAEAAGGLGLGLREAAVIAGEIGRALAPGPYLANVVLLPLLGRSAEPWLVDLAAGAAAGGRFVTVLERDLRHGPDARLLAEHGSGTRPLVILDAPAQDGGAMEVRLIEAPRFEERRPFDPTCPVAELDGAERHRADAAARIAPELAADVLAAARLWIAAELLGLAERAGDMSIAHAGTRRQFGGPIGAHQAIKHRIVDDYVLRQNAAAILAEAVQAFDAGRGDRFLLGHAARVAASEAAMSSTAHCIQVHGAFGFSAESPIHLAYKRARRLVASFGDTAASRMWIAGAIIEGTAA